MNKICTDREQAKKLIELGIDVSTADMDYIPFANNPEEYDCVINVWNNEHEEDWIPTWSLSALIDLMPKVNGHYPELCRGRITGEYYMWIEDTFDTQTYNNPIDAAFEMICWLIEQGHIKVNK